MPAKDRKKVKYAWYSDYKWYIHLFIAAGVDKPKGVLLTVSSEAVPKEPKQKGKLSYQKM